MTTAATKHTCNEGHGPSFGRKTAGCPRCDELCAGSKPRSWAANRKAAVMAQYEAVVAERAS